jgi:DNA-binding MarR family transcriptional regulator
MGGSMSVGYILLNIDRNGSPSTSLGPKMGMEARSLTRILRSMEDSGLVYRVHGEEDRRNVFIHLTEEGKKMRKKARATVIRYNEFLRENIPAKKLDTFIEVVTKINELTDPDLVYASKNRGK